MSTPQEAQERLKGIEGHVAVAIWCRDDVQERAHELNIEISDEEADGILDDVEHHQDANYGITWDCLDYGIEEIDRSRKESAIEKS